MLVDDDLDEVVGLAVSESAATTRGAHLGVDPECPLVAAHSPRVVSEPHEAVVAVARPSSLRPGGVAAGESPCWQGRSKGGSLGVKLLDPAVGERSRVVRGHVSEVKQQEGCCRGRGRLA